MASCNNNNMNVDRDTQMLVEYSRIYPLYSILSLRKIIKQFDGNREKVNEYLNKVNQRQTETKIFKIQSKLNPVPSIPEYNSCRESYYNSSNKERRRHVSAPQHQVPRILVLPPTKSHNSCVSLSPDHENQDLSFSPDSLNEGRGPNRNRRRENSDLLKSEESYEMQFYRLWKSISGEVEQQNTEESSFDWENQYVVAQQNEHKELEDRINELVSYRQYLIELNHQMNKFKQHPVDLNIILSN